MKHVVSTLSILFFAACTDSFGPGESSSLNSANGVSGVVSAGPVSAATVTAYKLNSDGSQGNQLATTTSDANGKYTLGMDAQAGPVIIIASGGSYKEEASGNTVNMGHAQIRTTLPNTSSGQQVGVTPVTEIATQNTLAAVTANPSINLSAIIKNSNASVAAAMGLTDITKPPANPNQPASHASSAEAAQYAVVLATLSQIAKTATTNAGSNVDSLDVTQALATAFTYNGSFNTTVGSGGSSQNIPVPNAGGSTLTLASVLNAAAGSGATFSSAMQLSMNTYLSSPDATDRGFDDDKKVPKPTFVTTPPPPSGTPALTPPTPPAVLPSKPPTVAGPPPIATPSPTPPLGATPSPTPSPTPVPSWAHTLQGGATGGDTYGASVATDTSGNVYVTGNTNVAIDGQIQHGSVDLFITKFNSSGTRLWTIQDGGAGGNTFGSGIATDVSGNIYVTGWTNVAIDGQTLNGICDLFITKYNSSGTRQWTIQDGAPNGISNGLAIAIDSSGNIYMTGDTNVAIDGQTLHGLNDLLIAKYSSNGARLWTIEDGATGGDTDGISITTDSSGSVYVAGYTKVAIDGQTQHGTSDLLVTKYNSSGTRQWTIQDGASSGYTFGWGMALDPSGNIFITGTTNVAIDGQAQHGTDDLYITKYNTNGTRLWTVQDSTSGATTYGNKIATDSLGNAYATGYTTSVAIDGQTQHGATDLVITKYNSSGTRQWTIQDGASGGVTSGSGIATDSSGNVFVTGYTSVAIDGQTQHGTHDLIIKQVPATP